ncbi:MAG: hypothetical protein ACRC1K_08900 [Planctomycetia bacterium]
MIALAGASVVVQWILTHRRLQRTRGTVVGHKEIVGSEGTLFFCELEYEAEGQTWRAIDDMGFGWRQPAVGCTVWVGCPPADPGRGRVWRVWPAFLGAGLVVVGVLFIAVALSRSV